MTYKFKTLKGKNIELSFDFIKKYIPFWNINKIFIADDDIESRKLDPRTKYSREYQFTRIKLDKNGEIDTCATFTDGLSSNTLKPSIFDGKSCYVFNGLQQYEEDWKTAQTQDIEVKDIFGNAAKIKSWVWFEYLTPSERESIVFVNGKYSEKERTELIKKLTDTFGSEKDFILYRDTESERSYIAISRLKVKDLKLMTGTLNTIEWHKMSPTITNRVRYASFYKDTTTPRYTVVNNEVLYEDQVYGYMIGSSNHYEFENYIKSVNQELSKDYISNGMRKDVYYELLKYNLLDNVILKNTEEFMEEYRSSLIDLGKHPPGTLIFSEELQRSILYTGIDVFFIDMTTTYDLTRILEISKQDIEIHKNLVQQLVDTEVPVNQLVDKTTMKFAPFGVGIFEFGDFYILVTPDLQSKAYSKILLSEDKTILNEFFSVIKTEIKPFLEKQPQELAENVAKTVMPTTVTSKVIQTALSDAVEVSKRVAVGKVMTIISNSIIENLKLQHKKNNRAIEATIKFLSSKEGKSVLMVMAGSILPSVKPLLGKKYEDVIDSISAELRISGETEIASSLVDLLGESLSKAFANLDLFEGGTEKLRVEVAPQLQASKSPVLDFIQNTDQETIKVNGTKIL